MGFQIFTPAGQSVLGNATTATALQTARAINGTSFDGTAAITVTAAAGTLTGATLAAGVTASSLTSVGTLAGLTTTGGAVFHTTSTALSDGAGVGAGTIATAPSAGNPTKWIGINDNGTTRYIPTW